MTKNKREAFNSWKSAIQKDLKILAKKSGLNLDAAQKQVQKFIKDAEQMMGDSDINKIIKTLKTEHDILVKNIDRTVKEEVRKANELLQEKKKSLKRIQRVFEKEFSISGKTTRKKTSRRKTSAKKTSRKTKKLAQ